MPKWTFLKIFKIVSKSSDFYIYRVKKFQEHDSGVKKNFWPYPRVPTTTQGCQNGIFWNLFGYRPTKVKMAQNDVNIQEKWLKIFSTIWLPRDTYYQACQDRFLHVHIEERDYLSIFSYFYVNRLNRSKIFWWWIADLS